MLMNTKRVLIVVLYTLLCSCSSTTPPQVTHVDSADAALAEASFAVSRSIVSLSQTAQASHPIPHYESLPSPASYGMAELTSIDWSGPVEPLVRQVARAANYRVRVLGIPPAIPVLVTLYDKNRMLADVLSDIGYQCGRRASIIIYPDSRVIELRYARS